MKSIFILQWQRLKRQPLMIVSMIVMTMLFIFFIGGSTDQSTIPIPTSFSDEISEEAQNDWIKELNELDGFTFQPIKEKVIKEQVALGNASFGLRVSSDSYTFITGTKDSNQAIVDQFLSNLYMENNQIEQVIKQTGNNQVETIVENKENNPPVTVKASVGETDGDYFVFDNKLHALFGMTLFFAIYTIVFTLSEVAEEKQRGSWDRLILSPIKKWQIYIGYLSYSFIIGMTQIIIVFVMFYYLFGFEIGSYWLEILSIVALYTFAIVSLGMLLIGFVRKSSQLGAIVPIVAVSMAMLGGAYWPIEIVENHFVLALSKGIPVTYAMDALKGVTIYQQSLAENVQSLATLFLMGVICMGVGINLMERR